MVSDPGPLRVEFDIDTTPFALTWLPAPSPRVLVESDSVCVPDEPPSNLAVTGIYCYDETVFEVIPTLTPSGRGELEITDVNNFFVSKGTMEYDVLDGFWGDAGESIDAYYQVNDFVRRHGANKG